MLQNMPMQRKGKAKGMDANYVEQVERQHKQLPALFSQRDTCRH